MPQDIDRFDDDTDSAVRTFPKGTVIFREGQVSDVAYVVKKGRVSIYRVLGNKRVRLGERGPGEMFGEMGVVTAEPRGSTAEALEYTEALVCDKRLLQTMLLKSPRPVQLLTGYLAERVQALAAQVTDRPSGDPFLAVCRILHLSWQAVARSEKPELDYAEVSRTIKDIVLLSQVEIDAIFERLKKLHLVAITEVKGHFPRTNILGATKPGPSYVKDRRVRLPDADKFLAVAKNLARDAANAKAVGVDLEFCDLADFAREAGTSPEIILKKIGYGDIPEKVFFFHKSASQEFIDSMGLEFFKQARRPRLTAADLEHVDDIVAVDNATLQEVFSSLGFHKVAVLSARAGEAARDKIHKNLSKKIAGIVREEAAAMADLDDDEAAAVEQELLDRIKAIKGLVS
jgi:CRP-like cAMP-binding protein